MEMTTKNVTINETENQETTVATEKEAGFKLGLYLKIAVAVIFAYGLFMFAWDNFLCTWWAFQAPTWLKTGLTWFIWLDVSYVIYKQVNKKEEQ